MHWLEDPAEHAATLITGAWRCRVWYTPTAASWAALLSLQGAATAADSFPTREAAQAWCEQQLMQRRKAWP